MAKKKEHTINEVYEAITEFSGFVKNQFKKNERVVKLLVEQQERTGKEIKDIKTTVGHIEQDILTVKEDVDAIASSVSDTALKNINHERRITRLERTR